MDLNEILKAKHEAVRFLEKVHDFECDNAKVYEVGLKIYPIEPKLASAALKRSSLDLWRQLAKMRGSK
jgi:hypothetical protein